MGIDYRRRFNMADGLIVTAATAATLATPERLPSGTIPCVHRRWLRVLR